MLILSYSWVAYIGLVLAVACCCALVCTNAARKVPLNYILCFFFTIGMSVGIAFITLGYAKETILMAALATALVTLSLTIYAMTTSTNLRVLYGMAFVTVIAFLPIVIISIVIRVAIMNTIIIAVVIIIYGIYLIIDTMEIVNAGKSYGGNMIDFDDYILGAMILYLDIIMIFTYILALLGGSGN